MSQRNETVARRWFDEVINGRRPDAVDEIFSPDYVHHGNLGDGMRRDEIKQFAAAMLAAYPDRRATIEDLIEQGDKVVVRWSSTGTRQGAFMGQPPTGRQETARGIWIARFEDGRAAEGWEVIDMGVTTE